MPTKYCCQSCPLHYDVGWLHYHRSEAGYGSQTRFVCQQCGTQHAVEHVEPVREFSQRETYNVELTAVASDARPNALRAIRERFQCTSQQAKERLDHLPCCMAIEVDGYEAKSVVAHCSGPGISINVTFAEARPEIVKERLLSALHPSVTDEVIAFVVVPSVVSVANDRLIDVSVQRCQACGAIGSLRGESEPLLTCPHCATGQLKATSRWVT